MPYERSQMLYNDSNYYKWSAQADKDNPYYRNGADHTELNRTEGYEVLYFINHLHRKHPAIVTDHSAGYQKVEKMIRYDVPHSIRTHKQIEEWIVQHWK